MKQRDSILIIVVVGISAVVSILLSRWLFASPKARQQQVQVVSAISPTFNTSTITTYINNKSYDPTQLIQIGTTTNPNPFNGQK